LSKQYHIRWRKCQKYFYVTHWQKNIHDICWLLYLYTFHSYRYVLLTLQLIPIRTSYVTTHTDTYFLRYNSYRYVLLTLQLIPIRTSYVLLIFKLIFFIKLFLLKYWTNTSSILFILTIYWNIELCLIQMIFSYSSQELEIIMRVSMVFL
jgi:hypothetical protein